MSTATPSPDGRPRAAGALVARELSVGGMDNRAYLLTDPAADPTSPGSSLLVDAAAEPERLLALVAAASSPDGPALGAVLTTHRHADHTGALAAVLAATGAAALAGAEDADALPAPVTRRLGHGDVVTVGSVACSVLALRGHTPGSVALLVPGAAGTAGEPAAPQHLFTGDSLFPGGPGRTTSPADFASLMDDLEARVFGPLGDEVVVRPGHGEATTLGAERPHLTAWRRRGW